MAELPVKDIPPKLRLYLQCSPSLDLQYRYLPRSGGYYDQDFEDIIWFQIIEQRIKEIMIRKHKQGYKKE